MVEDGITILKFIFREVLTTQSRVLLQKLIIAEMIRKIIAAYGTRTFITIFTASCH
jgi:hypothetical protein